MEFTFKLKTETNSEMNIISDNDLLSIEIIDYTGDCFSIPVTNNDLDNIQKCINIILGKKVTL
jgi:hypothetical protein|nr:MAG TPA: hypothetical protein [Caudoviricetes sp.]